MPIVEAPDGNEIEFPDEMAQGDIDSALQKLYPKPILQERIPQDPLQRAALNFQEAGIRTAPVDVGRLPIDIGGTKIMPTEGIQLPRVETPPEAGPLEKTAAGLYNLGIGIPNFVASPEGVLTSMAPELLPSKIAGPLIKGIFGGLTAKQAGEALGKASVTKDVQDIAEGVGATLLSPFITLHGGLNAKDQIKSTGGIPVEQQGVPIDRGTEEQAQGRTPQRSGEGEQAVPLPTEVQAIKPNTKAQLEAEAFEAEMQASNERARRKLAGEQTKSTTTLPQLVKELGRDKVDELIANWDGDAELHPSGKYITTLSDPRNQTGKTKASTKDFLSWYEEQKVPPTAITGEAPPTAPAAGAANVEGVAAPPTEPAKAEATATTAVTQEPLSQGPGAASPGDVPPSPRIAEAIENDPQTRPIGPTSPISIGLNNAINGAWDWVKGVAGQSMPKTTSADRLVGEAGVRYASSRIAAKPLADSFAAHALEGTDVDPIKFGAALTEDNLRSVREALRQKATELGANGDLEGAAIAADKGNSVASIIGANGSPFKTEDEYFDFLSDPATKKAIHQHVQLWKEVIEPQYKQAQSIDPDVELPTRGQQTGARINLKAVLPDEPATRPVSGVGSPQLTGTLKKKTPFSIKAKGTGQAYDINYGDIIGNTFTRQLEIANKNAFDDALVKSGNAVIDSPGQTISVKGEPTVAFPLARKSIVSGGQTIPVSKNIYVRKSLSNEYRTASNVNERHSLGFATKVLGGINRIALAGLTDFSVHTSNLMTALFNRPASSKLLTDTILSATGRADIPVTLTKAIIKGFQDNKDQVSELANIGAMRPQDPAGWSGRILRAVDKTTRLVLDDTFQSLVKEGVLPDTETARREYVNQVGQYNRRLQGPMTRWLRETGFGPFVTAGKTFNSLGVKMITLSPGSKATSLTAAAALRANVLSKWVGAAVLVGSLNYLLTKKVSGRPGTPIGNIDFGTNDKAGKQQSFPLFSLIGLGRGLRATGIKGFTEAKRLGLSTADAADTAARDIINSWVAPAAGPPVKALFVAASGYPPAVKVGRASRVAPPGSSQLVENVKEAAIEANPLIQGVSKVMEGKPISEAISGQLPRLAMAPGKSENLVANYPKIVTMARANEFTEDVIFQARRMPFSERRKFVNEQVQRLPQNLREHARREIERRRVYSK